MLQSKRAVNVAGTQVHLNEDQVSAENMFNKNYPILVVNSAYGAGKSLCTAVMAQEAVLKREKILGAAVQNSALDVVGSEIVQLQSNQIKLVRYVNDLMANDPSNASQFALQLLIENFHQTHLHLLSDWLHKKFQTISDSRREMPTERIPLYHISSPEPNLKKGYVAKRSRFTLIGDSKHLPPYIGVHSNLLAVEVSSSVELRHTCGQPCYPGCGCPIRQSRLHSLMCPANR
ncbi:hypothetical protein ANCDUO_19901 [Ancylostoma duodenale]|uniref:Uncharacterized protein n=1 Tax=Ancylostoma duodenale TaxID=51022 RepID=A0A0C2C194_9BILA|nr:hypothetical protein ANCDUO_19901 [Ancylostoma duodenale]